MPTYDPNESLRTVRFLNSHLHATMTGRKKITVRLYDRARHHFEMHQRFLGEFGNDEIGMLPMVLVATHDTRVCALREVTMAECEADGCADHVALMALLSTIYEKPVTMDSVVGVIRFEMSRHG